jgi:hypothetical protein
MVVRACNPSTSEGKARHRKLKASLGYTGDPVSKKKKIKQYN